MEEVQYFRGNTNNADYFPLQYWLYPSTVRMLYPNVLIVSPYGTEHPAMYLWYIPIVLMISPTVLNIVNGTVPPQSAEG